MRRPRLDQTKKRSSLIETVAGIGVGLLLQTPTTFFLLTQNGSGLLNDWGGEHPFGDWLAPAVLVATVSGIIFTAISVVRTFSMRRLFNWLSKEE